MKQMIFLALLSLSVSAPAAPDGAATTRTTVKAVDSFAQCFARAEDHTSEAWSFVPKESGGGTFSNAGAKSAGQPYFLEIADRGTRRDIRLTPAASVSVLRAVDGCI